VELHSDTNPALNTVTAYGKNFIEVNRVTYNHAIYFQPEGDIHPWSATEFDDITSDELCALAGLEQASSNPLDFLEGTAPTKPDDAPEVVLVGTGTHQHLLPEKVTRPLLRVGIGVEAMSTLAAARTYNILMAEGRRVIVAMLPHEEIL